MTDEPGSGRLEIADDVAAVIGPELVDRYRTTPHMRQGQCWTCSAPADAETEPLSLLVIVVDVASADTPFVRMSHRRCAPSRIERATREDIAAKRGPDEPEPDGYTQVTVKASLWPPGDIDNPRPVLFVSFDSEVTVATPDGESDVMVTYFLERGWHLATRIGRPITGPAPEQTGVFWHVDNGAYLAGPGRLIIARLNDPTDPATLDPIADVDPCATGTGWAAAAMMLGSVEVYIGPFAIHTWGPEDIPYATVKQAFKSGRTVGARLPTAVTDNRGELIQPPDNLPGM